MRTLRLPLLLALVAALVLGAPGAGTSAGLALTEVVVTFNGEGAPSAADVAVLEAVGITTAITFRALPIAGALATPAQVDALVASPWVASVYPNSALTYDNATSTNLTGVDAVRADAKLTKKNGNLPVAGHGVTVLVNDSGIDGGHLDHRFGPHLVQNVEAATNLHAVSELAPVTYVENVENTDATGGHGTHVAGIVGATGARSNGKYEGVAPGAKLVGYGSGAGLAILDVIGGFDYAIANRERYGIDVITNSWGDTDDSCTAVDPNHPVTRATYDTYEAGIVVVFSAGNSGPDPCTISGNYKKAPWVISVAAGDKDRADRLLFARFGGRRRLVHARREDVDVGGPPDADRAGKPDHLDAHVPWRGLDAGVRCRTTRRCRAHRWPRRTWPVSSRCCWTRTRR